jgi:hypothetical protein
MNGGTVRDIRTYPIRGVITAALAAGVVLLTGCDSSPAGPAAAPTGATPAGTAASAAAEPAAGGSAAPTGALAKECKAIQSVLIEGSVDIAEDSVKGIDKGYDAAQLDTDMKKRFGQMAAELRKQAGTTTDPALKALATNAADELAGGTTAKDPNAFMKDRFQSIATEVDRKCGA